MYALGYTINVLTLLGLVLAIGLVVDDAIVVLENVHRRTELGEPSLVAAITGTQEIGFAVIATTLTLVSVFVPISFLPWRHRSVVPRVRIHARGSRRVLGIRGAHAHADVGVAAAGPCRPEPLRCRHRSILQGAHCVLRPHAARRDAPALGGRHRGARAGGAGHPDVSFGAFRIHAASRRRPRPDFARGPRGLEHGVHGPLRAAARADRDGRHGKRRNRPRADPCSGSGRLGSAHG